MLSPFRRPLALAALVVAPIAAPVIIAAASVTALAGGMPPEVEIDANGEPLTPAVVAPIASPAITSPATAATVTVAAVPLISAPLAAPLAAGVATEFGLPQTEGGNSDNR